MLVYDLTNATKSLEQLTEIIGDIERGKDPDILPAKTRLAHELPFYPMILVGNKVNNWVPCA